MSAPLLGEIKMFAFNWAPVDYALCDGKVIPVNENPALFALLSTAFGGDGRTTFGLPDLRGRVPVGEGSTDRDYIRGYKGGVESVTLNLNNIPIHTHQMYGVNDPANLPTPIGTPILANSETAEIYSGDVSDVELASGTCSSTGGGLAHNNMMPFTTINYCIALKGDFPSRN